MNNIVIKEKDLSHLYLAQSKIPGAGDGVYSKINIPKGTIVEKANVIPISAKKVEDTPLMDYVFNNPYKDGEFLVAFGFGSMYNHSDEPHMTYKYDPDENKIIYEAIKDIKAGEEIYISYGPNWWSARTDKTKVDVIPKNKDTNPITNPITKMNSLNGAKSTIQRGGKNVKKSDKSDKTKYKVGKF